MEKGKYIVIEGGDATGKSTQAEILANKLNEFGLETLLIEEPGSTIIGNEIRRIVKNGDLPRLPMTNVMLVTAGRIELWNEVIKPSIDSGKWVVSARNWYSMLAYQGYGEGLDLDFIESFTKEYVSNEYTSPNLSFVLTHNSHDEIVKRMANRNNDEENDYFEKNDSINKLTVDESYRLIAQRVGAMALEIDGLSVEEVHGKIWDVIKKNIRIKY